MQPLFPKDHRLSSRGAQDRQASSAHFGERRVKHYPTTVKTPETLIKMRTAMYTPSNLGATSTASSNLNDLRAVERQSLEEQLRSALERRSCLEHYQPK